MTRSRNQERKLAQGTTKGSGGEAAGRRFKTMPEIRRTFYPGSAGQPSQGRTTKLLADDGPNGLRHDREA